MGEITPATGVGAPYRWRLALLGETVELTGPGIRWLPGGACSLLLAFVALEGPTPRQRLAGMLWPERPEARARANLRQLLLRLRAVAPVVDGDPLRLAPDVRVDVRDLGATALAGSARDRLLAGVDASPWPGLAAWLEDRRSSHEAGVRRTLMQDIAAAREGGDLPAAAAAAERLARLDPWSETACQAVMEVALAQGEPATALRAFRALRRALKRDVGAEPSEETVALAGRAARAAGRARPAPDRAADDGRRVARRAESGGWLREGAELLARMADGLDEGRELAQVLTELAWLEHRLGWNRRAQEHAERALAISGEGGHSPDEAAERPSRADACFVLGSLAWHGGDLAAARDRWGQALRSLRRGDRAARLRLSLDLALVEDALERPAAARRHYLAALALARELEDRPAEAEVLNNLGAQLAREGRAPEGMALLRRAYAIARERRDRLLEGYVLDSIARAHLAGRASKPRTGGPDVVDHAAAGDEAGGNGAGDHGGGNHGRAGHGRAGHPGGLQAAGDPDTGGYAAAHAAAAQAAAIAMDAGDVRLQIEAFLTLSRVSQAEGDVATARRFAEAALARAASAGWAPLVTSARELLAGEREEAGGRDAGVTTGDAG